MLKMGSEKKKKRSRASTKSMISFNDIESMLLNLALVSALLASIILSLVLTITTEELDLADRFYLASRHYLFRHHFRPDATLLPCAGEINANETMSHIYVMSGDGPMLLDRAMKDAGVASPGTRLRVLGFLMHTSLSAEDLEHRERRWMADNTDESAKVIAE